MVFQSYGASHLSGKSTSSYLVQIYPIHVKKEVFLALFLIIAISRQKCLILSLKYPLFSQKNHHFQSLGCLTLEQYTNFIIFSPTILKTEGKVGYFEPHSQLQLFEGRKLQIWFSPKYSKTMRQILLILQFYIKNYHRRPQEPWARTGNVIF